MEVGRKYGTQHTINGATGVKTSSFGRLFLVATGTKVGIHADLVAYATFDSCPIDAN